MTHRPPHFGVPEEWQLRSRESEKWGSVDPDVLPLWVADMDFPVATAILDRMQAAVAEGDLGYPRRGGVPGSREACADRLRVRFDWHVDPAQVQLLPGIIPGLFACVEVFTEPGDEILVPTPLYPWFVRAVERTGRRPVEVDLTQDESGRYRLDLAAMEARIGPATKMAMWCNPHNPTGRAFGRSELEDFATLAVDHDLWIVSDEVHADLQFGGEHIPVASLDPSIGNRTLTLYGPTKAFNIAGLGIGFAIAQNRDALEALEAFLHGRIPEGGVVAQTAAKAAFEQGDPWLEATLAYLDQNRRTVAAFVASRLPGVRHVPPDATYLAWLDFRDTPLADKPAERLLERARVALNEGADFGAAGTGFVRLNFATSRSIVIEALERIARALDAA